MKVVTHDGPFHADDVFADAVLRAALGDIHLVRSRDPAVIDSADLVFDVGSEHDPAAHRYDQHCKSTAAVPWTAVRRKNKSPRSESEHGISGEASWAGQTRRNAGCA